MRSVGARGRGLEAGAGIDSYTIAALVRDLDRHGARRWLSPATVVVVDEAAMVGTRTLASLLDHAENAGCKAVLVGDHHQLPEIDAGGLFRGLAARLDAIQLCDNRRQIQPWERDALDHLRTGTPAIAVAAYAAHERIVVAPTAGAVRQQLVDDWWDATRHRLDSDGLAGAIMVAARRSDVDDLNSRARTHLAAAGELTGPTLSVGEGEREFRVGDHVMTLHNDKRLGVINGTRGRISAVDVKGRTISLDVDGQQRTVTLPEPYLDAGYLTHGYAITAHKAQGATTDRAFILGSDAMYREWGYVALSRARLESRLYLVDHRGNDRNPDLDSHGTISDARDPLLVAARALQRSRSDPMASDHQPIDVTTQQLRDHALQIAGGIRSMPRDPSRACASLAADLAAARDARADAEARVAEATEHATAARRGLGRIARRSAISAAERELARAGAERDAWTQRLASLDQRAVVLDQQGVARRHWLLEHSAELADYAATLDRLPAAEHAEATIVELEAGERPDGLADRGDWRRTLHDVHRGHQLDGRRAEPDVARGIG